MKKKSLGVNAILNGVKSIMSILFPLITFPYVSRVLQAENLGKYNFALTFVSYFILLAGLGVSTYAVREGAKYRDDKEVMSKFASEVFTINVASTVVSYFLLVLCVLIIPKFAAYSTLIWILSLEILFTTLGLEWIYTIYEEFVYISIRSILFHLIAVILMFLLIKTSDDYVKYAGITAFATIGANIVNFICLHRFIDLRLTTKFDLKEHLRPILLLFATAVATTIYVNFDVTMLGFMTTDRNVGIYTAAVKIYKIVKSFLSGVIIVSVPRLANYIGTGKIDEFRETFKKVFSALITLVLPAMVGLFCLSPQIVLLLSGRGYAGAEISLRILSVALLFSMFSWLYTSCVLITNKREKKVLIATAISAATNVILNFFLIPIWQENAAALTTVIAEAISAGLCMWYSRDIITAKPDLKEALSIVIGCVLIAACCFTVISLNINVVLTILISVFASVSLYGLVLILFKNRFIFEYVLKRK